MAKAKIWILVLLCIGGAMLLVSCAKPKNVLIVQNDESGWYPVDVAKWYSIRVTPGEPPEWYHTVTDATLKLTAHYANPGLGTPTYPGDRSVHLNRYTITWKSSVVKIPRLTGSLDVTVPLDLTGSGKGAAFELLVCPATNKDTVTALADLLGDPDSDPNTFVGQVIVNADVQVSGTDLLTDEDVSATIQLTAAFADYLDPNTYH
jgi:hypothetical protein